MAGPLQEVTRHNVQPAVVTPTKQQQQQVGKQPGGRRTPKIAVIAAANRLRDVSGTPGRVTSAGALTFGGISGTHAPALRVENDQYEAWMKIATDNKITSTNTWNLALIDYFHEMSLLRNNDDNSINFQKASCTLDGCVKIWTSRVDSVATETGKLLSGLAEDGRSGAADHEENEDDADDDEGTEARKAKRKVNRQATTLADSFSKIKVKSFDLEFTVDPLFKKTSADFDEGGAGGILMNHLGCDRNMKVVFDAGDAKLDNSEEGEVPEDEDEAAGNSKVDIGRLRSKFLPSLEALQHYVLCPTFASFRFNPESNVDLQIVNPVDVELTPAVGGIRTGRNSDEHDVFAGMDFGGGGPEGDDEDGGAAVVDFFESGPGADPFDPDDEPTPFGSTKGVDHHSIMLTADGDGEQIFDYFDSKVMKNWAGPEHWKMRKVITRTDEKGSTTNLKTRKEKEAFALDFSSPPLISLAELFATAPASSIRSARKSSVMSSQTTSKTTRRLSRPSAIKEELYILPDDFHFSSDLLLRLFLKPKTTFKHRKRMQTLDINDAKFWAETGNSGGYDQDMGGMDANEFDFGNADSENGDGGNHPPIATQFSADDDDLPYFDEDESEEQNFLTETQGQLKRVRPENVNYAKRAKRIDVKKLKESIWKELEVVTIPVKQFPSELAYSREPSKEEALVPVVSRLREVYPQDKMEEISTSFCFICLLHLANEKGLRIQTPVDFERGGEGGENGVVEDGLLACASVGGLDGLRVLREVHS